MQYKVRQLIWKVTSAMSSTRVRESFTANFERDHEVGAAVAVYHRGVLVVDLAGACAIAFQTRGTFPKDGTADFLRNQRDYSFRSKHVVG